ncbi:MAG TPA: ECF-type sigma factor [Tahibacter sp.]|uniref:ECF-type sigma factor n=1 Tax=Tahibacter sp. TaxID=2056211 RepID=UPI002C8A33FE|nr:ECF-type sigma factor [Tahibacter sp.]HSX59472.1 ECF-type sigma factor [Tahibacter sp.]
MTAPAITDLLERWRAGEADAADALMRAVYPMLREIAGMRLRRYARGATLQPTELANEAYARLHQARATDWRDRAHFFAFSARVIRNLAVDHVRARGRDKRGGDVVLVPLADAHELPQLAPDVDVLAIDRVLSELEREDAELAQIVELKFFSGLETDEIAEACGISRATVVRRWRYARAWLAARLADPGADDAP